MVLVRHLGNRDGKWFALSFLFFNLEHHKMEEGEQGQLFFVGVVAPAFVVRRQANMGDRAVFVGQIYLVQTDTTSKTEGSVVVPGCAREVGPVPDGIKLQVSRVVAACASVDWQLVVWVSDFRVVRIFLVILEKHGQIGFNQAEVTRRQGLPDELIQRRSICFTQDSIRLF